MPPRRTPAIFLGRSCGTGWCRRRTGRHPERWRLAERADFDGGTAAWDAAPAGGLGSVCGPDRGRERRSAL